MSFGDSELHGHFDKFFLGLNQSDPRMSAIANHIFLHCLGTTSWSMAYTTPKCKFVQNWHPTTTKQGPSRFHTTGIPKA